MEIVVHSKKSLFQQKFQKKLYHLNKYSQFKSVILKIIQLDIWSLTNKSTLTPSVVRNPTPTPPKTSDSLRLWLQLCNTAMRSDSLHTFLCSKHMCACEQIRVHAMVIDHLSDPGLHRILCYTLLSH